MKNIRIHQQDIKKAFTSKGFLNEIFTTQCELEELTEFHHVFLDRTLMRIFYVSYNQFSRKSQMNSVPVDKLTDFSIVFWAE